MDLQTRKIEFIQEFLKVQHEDIVERLEKLLRKETSKIESPKLDPFSTEELISRINRSMHDSSQNLLTTNKDLLNEIQKWR